MNQMDREQKQAPPKPKGRKFAAPAMAMALRKKKTDEDMIEEAETKGGYSKRGGGIGSG